MVTGMTDLVHQSGRRSDVLDPLHACLWHFVGPGNHLVPDDVGLIHGPVGHWDPDGGQLVTPGPFPWSQIFLKIISCRSKIFQNSIKLFGFFTIKCAVYYISLFFCLLNTFCCCIYISEMGGQNRYGSPTWTNHLKDCTKGGNQLSKINIMIYLLIINISNIIVCVFSSAFRTGRKKSLARIISFFSYEAPCENTW